MRTKEQEDRLRALSWVPNALTGFRLFIAGPVVFMLYAWEFGAALGHADSMVPYIPYRWIAVVVVVLALISEFLDGFLARRYKNFGWMTDFGADLDPWADKAFGIWCLPPIVMHLGFEPYLVFVGIPVAYVFYYSFVTQWMRRNKLLVGASIMAKRKTATLMLAQFLAYLAFAVQPAGVTIDEAPLATAVFTAAMGVTMIGGVMCFFALREYRDNIRTRNLQPAE